MDPNNSQSQGDNASLKKLEEDLKNLEKETSSGQSIPDPIASTASTLPIDKFPPAPSTPTPEPVETITQTSNSSELPKKNKLSLIVVAVVLVVIALLATIAYVVGRQFIGGNSLLPVTPQACTAEAKICPDGSAVGREGPNCEFAACPVVTSTPIPMEGVQTFTGSNFVYANTVYSGYSFLFPPTCSQEVSTLDCKFAHGTGTIIVNAGGHGGDNIETRVIRNNETKIIPAGEGKITEVENVKEKTVFGTFWINKTDKFAQEPIFGFEFMNIPLEDLAEFEKTFDQMLTTFKFVEGTISPIPTPAGL